LYVRPHVRGRRPPARGRRGGRRGPPLAVFLRGLAGALTRLAPVTETQRSGPFRGRRPGITLPSANWGRAMKKRRWTALGMTALASVLVPVLLEASSQEPRPQDPKPGPDKKGDFFKGDFFGKKGKGPGGFGFGFGPGGKKRELVKRFDKNGD